MMSGDAAGQELDCGITQSRTVSFDRVDLFTYRLKTCQTLPLSRTEAFSFFQDPRKLSCITPPWLAFRMADGMQITDVYEGAEFDYTLRWLLIPIRWRSRIVDYRPPERFVDIQIRGPYRSWSHLHLFREVPAGTELTDVVTHRIPWFALPLYSLVIQRQLRSIFNYRAVTIARWAMSRDRGGTCGMAGGPAVQSQGM